MNNTPRALKWLMTSSGLYIAIVSIGAVVAIVENRPPEAWGTSNSLPVWQAFLVGSGTAMSPPLNWLIAQAILTALAPRRDRWGAASIVGLIVIGLLFSAFGALEPIVLEIFSPKTFSLLKATIVAGGVVLALLMMLSGVLELVRRRKCKRVGLAPAGC
jgi:hypothetical protein